jgi:hypothetical protein
MPQAGFEPAIQASERPQTHAATGIGRVCLYTVLKCWHRLLVCGVLKCDPEVVVSSGLIRNFDKMSARLEDLTPVILDINRYLFHVALLCVCMLYLLTTFRTSNSVF